MKKLRMCIMLALICATLLTQFAFAGRSIGSYDTYLGMGPTYKIYTKTRTKATADIPGVDNNEFCEMVDFGATSYTTAIGVHEPKAAVAAMSENYSGERVLLYYSSGFGKKGQEYSLGLRSETGFISLKGSWSPDHK